MIKQINKCEGWQKTAELQNLVEIAKLYFFILCVLHELNRDYYQNIMYRNHQHFANK